MKFIKRILIAALIVPSVGMAAGQQTRSSALPNCLQIADPTILLDGDNYYLYGTALETGFQAYRSTDLENWEGPLGEIKGNFVLKKGVSCHVQDRFWAPQVIKYKNKYHMFYAGDNFIVHAKADSPLGPFTEDTMEAMPSKEQEIDPFVFIDKDGTPYIYWSNRVSGTQSILGAQMTEDLEDIKRDTQKTLFRSFSQGWEVSNPRGQRIVEGPAVVEHDGTYYMLYSANGCDDVEYAVGVATASSPLGLWTKQTSPIISKETLNENGPGHGDLFYDKNGKLMYVFHVHHDDATVYPRRTVIMELQFKDGQIVPVADSFRFLILTNSITVPVESSECVPVKIKSNSGLVVGGTDTPSLVEPKDNDDTQVFYMIQTSYNNWADGRPATYPGFFLVQKSSGKYLVEDGMNYKTGFGVLAYSDTSTELNGSWVLNNDAEQMDVEFQISLNKTGNRIYDAGNGKVATSSTVGDPGTAFRFELCNYTGDVWMRGPGIFGTGEWEKFIKLEKDPANPGVYTYDRLPVGYELGLYFELQNGERNYTLNLSPYPKQHDIEKPNRALVKLSGENNLQFVPYQYYYSWQFPKAGTYNLRLDLNKMSYTVEEIPGAGVEEIGVETEKTARYYNLQGVEVDNPENGVYIRVAGNKATKVMIR